MDKKLVAREIMKIAKILVSSENSLSFKIDRNSLMLFRFVDPSNYFISGEILIRIEKAMKNTNSVPDGFHDVAAWATVERGKLMIKEMWFYSPTEEHIAVMKEKGYKQIK